MAFVLEWWWAILGGSCLSVAVAISLMFGGQLNYINETYSRHEDMGTENRDLARIATVGLLMQRKYFYFAMMWLGLITFILAGILVTLLKGNT
mgnify:CR=1 FL=1